MGPPSHKAKDEAGCGKCGMQRVGDPPALSDGTSFREPRVRRLYATAHAQVVQTEKALSGASPVLASEAGGRPLARIPGDHQRQADSDHLVRGGAGNSPAWCRRKRLNWRAVGGIDSDRGWARSPRGDQDAGPHVRCCLRRADHSAQSSASHRRSGARANAGQSPASRNLPGGRAPKQPLPAPDDCHSSASGHRWGVSVRRRTDQGLAPVGRFVR